MALNWLPVDSFGRRIPAVLSAVVLCLAFGAVTQATTLTPGASNVPDLFTLSCGPALATTTSAFTSTNGKVTATLTASVCSDPSNPFGAGDLDFLYQLTNGSASVDGVGRITAIDFTGWSTDVGYATNLGGTASPQLVDRNPGGDTVGFAFATPLPTYIAAGQTSNVLVIKTNATNYKAGVANIIDGGVTSEPAYEPASGVPEPASLVMMGAGLLLIGGFKRFRA